MDFLDFFGLKDDPFRLTPDPAYFYPSASHNEGLLLLDYSIEQKEGFTVVLGDPGSGKTTLLNVFLEKWRSRAEIAMILTPRLAPEEFLVSVLEDLNIRLKRKNKNEIIKAFRDFMIEKSAENRRVIVIVDEAQNLPDDTMEELRLLSNLETDKDKLLQIVLIGQPELALRLKSDALRQLDQRIITRINLRHLTPDEILDYINHRLIKAGKRNLKIDRKAAMIIYRLTNGVPRLINILMARTLMAAYLEESNTLLPRHITHAVKSLNHSDMKISRLREAAPLLITAGLFISLLGAGAYIYLHNDMKAETQDAVKAAQSSAAVTLTEAVPRTPVTEPDAQPAEPPVQDINSRNAAAVTKNGGSTKETAAIQQEPLPDDQHITVGTYIANVREAFSLNSKILGRAVKGSSFEILQVAADEENRKWYKIIFKGKPGWISEEVTAGMEN